MSEENKYKISYDVERGKFTKEQLIAKGRGGCDELGLISVLGGVLNSKSMSVQMISIADDKEWDGNQWFEIWALMAHSISEMKGLTHNRKQIVEEAFAKVKEIKLKGRGN